LKFDGLLLKRVFGKVERYVGMGTFAKRAGHLGLTKKESRNALINLVKQRKVRVVNNRYIERLK